MFFENETPESYYGPAYERLCVIQQLLLDRVETLRRWENCGGKSAVEHCEARLKSPVSARAKLRRQGFEESGESALIHLHDLVGIRLVCTFPSSVYTVARTLAREFDVIQVKDYIRAPKPNGYRSYHMILRFAGDPEIRAEIQLRTIAMDCWASLEHQLKYKQSVPRQALIVSELKRCADELAAADLTMQTLAELLAQGDEGAQSPLEALEHESFAG